MIYIIYALLVFCLLTAAPEGIFAWGLIILLYHLGWLSGFFLLAAIGLGFFIVLSMIKKALTAIEFSEWNQNRPSVKARNERVAEEWAQKVASKPRY